MKLAVGFDADVMELNLTRYYSQGFDDQIRFRSSTLQLRRPTLPIRFNLSEFAESHSLRTLPRSGVSSTTVNGITFQSFLAKCGINHIDLMKVDIEDSEIELFANLPNDLLQRIDQMTVEFHDFKPEFALAAKVRAKLDRLIGLG